RVVLAALPGVLADRCLDAYGPPDRFGDGRRRLSAAQRRRRVDPAHAEGTQGRDGCPCLLLARMGQGALRVRARGRGLAVAHEDDRERVEAVRLDELLEASENVDIGRIAELLP